MAATAGDPTADDPTAGHPTAGEGAIVRPMLLVYGPRSTDYDFGPDHPLTPRRFGPSIDLLALGRGVARPGARTGPR